MLRAGLRADTRRPTALAALRPPALKTLRAGVLVCVLAAEALGFQVVKLWAVAELQLDDASLDSIKFHKVYLLYWYNSTNTVALGAEQDVNTSPPLMYILPTGLYSHLRPTLLRSQRLLS